MALPSESSQPRLAAGCRWRDQGEQRVVLFPEGMIRLQGTGLDILELCDGQRTLREIVTTLVERYGAANPVKIMEDNSNALSSNLLSTPTIVFQNNHFTEAYFKGTISFHHANQEWKFGVESDNIFLHERFADVITDPSQFDPATPTAFSFLGNRPDLEQSAFVQDLIRLGKWTVSAGVRWDHYQLIVNQNALSPRLGVSRYFAKNDLLIHAAYDRVFQTPSFENILLSSSPEVWC